MCVICVMRVSAKQHSGMEWTAMVQNADNVASEAYCVEQAGRSDVVLQRTNLLGYSGY